MFEWLWLLAQVPGTVTETPAAAEEKVECQPEYKFGSWVFDREERRFKGTRVVAYRYYWRNVTEVCSGDSTTETTRVGPIDKWEAVPGERVADVNAPQGEAGAPTGTPLRSSQLPERTMPEVGPREPESSGSQQNSGPAPNGPGPLNPVGFLLVGAVVSAWVGRRFWPKGGPDPEAVDERLLEAKKEQYLGLARAGKYDVEGPQFEQDPAFAEFAELKKQASPEAMSQIAAWQDQWKLVGRYWKKFFREHKSEGAPPEDPWGVGEIAREQAKTELNREAQEFRRLLYGLFLHQDEFDARIGDIQAVWSNIQHWRSVLDPKEADHLLNEVLVWESEAIGLLLVDLKRRQIEELRKNGMFSVDDPQFKDDPRFAPFAGLWPLAGEEAQAEVKAVQSQWQEWLKERARLDNMDHHHYPGRPTLRDPGEGEAWDVHTVQSDSSFSLIGPMQVEGFKVVDGKMETVQVAVSKPIQMPLEPNTFSSTGAPGHRIHPIRKTDDIHLGADYGAKAGTPIYAAHNGIVEHAGWLGGYGYAVIVKGSDGISTLYAHMQEKPSVSEGDEVAPGTLLGKVGQTGTATGPHLHFEVFVEKDGERVYLVPEDVANLQRGMKHERVKRLQELLHEHGYGSTIGEVDDQFGPKTEEAVKKFQKAHGLIESGIVDEATALALQGAPPKRSTQTDGQTTEPKAHRRQGIDGVVDYWREIYGLTSDEEMAVRITALFEGSRGFENITGTFDGMGVSFGFAQWNLGQGTLQGAILVPLQKERPDVFYRHFPHDLTLDVGERTYTMEQILQVGARTPEMMAICAAIGQQVDDHNSKWRKAFEGLAQEDYVMRLQLAGAHKIMEIAKSEMTSATYLDKSGNPFEAKSWTVRSPQALALLYDVHTQNGSFGRVWDDIEAGLQGRTWQSEEELLRYLAWHVSNGSNSQWKSDVWSRKIAIVEGAGTVHSTNFRFDWESHTVQVLGRGVNVSYPQDLNPLDYLKG